MHGIKFSSFLRVGSCALDAVEQLLSRPALRSYFAEFIATFVFVFAGIGSATSAGKLMTSNATSLDASQTVATALAHGFALSSATYVACDISGGHLNPAVTFGFVVGGHIGLLTGIFYCAAQLFGATLACAILSLITGKDRIPPPGLHPGVSGTGAAALECVATFTLVYCVYATWAARSEQRRSTCHVVVGFICAANMLVLGPFTGGSMNPARSFGPAVVSGDFREHWVYWAGPIAGGALAGLVYQNCMPLPPPAFADPPSPVDVAV